MKSLATPEFWQRYAALPAHIKQLARRVYKIWSDDPQHGSLRFKKIGRVWSVRVGRDYRTLGLLKDDTVHWFWIGPHDEYERLLKK